MRTDFANPLISLGIAFIIATVIIGIRSQNLQTFALMALLLVKSSMIGQSKIIKVNKPDISKSL